MKGFVAPSPLVVLGIAIAVGFVNVVTISLPPGTNPAGFLIGYLVTPLILAGLYWLWYRRRHPTHRP